MSLVIAGGGIGGLTLALTARRAGMNPIIIQPRSSVATPSFGGGIGLWPPSQMVFQQLEILDKIQSVSGTMPKASYFNHKGVKLGQPSLHFSQKYKILCLQREKLSKILYEECVKSGVQVRTQLTVTNAFSNKQGVEVILSNGQKIKATALIGADGINSTVRNMIMKERKMPQIKPYHCGYAYFRAVVDVQSVACLGQQDRWHKFAFESWGEQKRFGYVPLKDPAVFWFLAIPINTDGLAQYYGSHVCSQQRKNWLVKQIKGWKGPVDIDKLIELTPAQTILRTDIRKIKNVTEFPWDNKNGNILIMGDAANATAPNLAQGAGLSIQSAWDLITMIDFKTGNGLQSFTQKRKKRAETVQNMADLVATVGQTSRPLSDIRDFTMSFFTKAFSGIQQRIFQSVVRYSLGGSSGSLNWLTPLNVAIGSLNQKRLSACLLGSLIGKDFNQLPAKTQQFRASLIGRGMGVVNTQSNLLARIFGLPKSMVNSPFGAYVETFIDKKTNALYQKWTRVFGQGQIGAVKYSTHHRAIPNFSSKTGLILTQSESDTILGDILRFGYDIKVNGDQISYKSKGLWMWNYQLPLPNFLLMNSEWTETQTKQGWKFNGVISLPLILGKLKFFKYQGQFVAGESIPKNVGKSVVIAGGTGMIGSETARYFYLKGWKVTILSRKGTSCSSLPFAQVVQWNPSSTSSTEIDRISQIFQKTDVIINLAGENPGASRWSDKFKKQILSSRLNSIQLIAKAIKQSQNSSIKFIQASAAGVYGNRLHTILNDNTEIASESSFRINTAKSIEEETLKIYPNAMIARIGHVLSSNDGIFPFLKAASACRIKSYGIGGQYIPWIHVKDTAAAFFHMGNNVQHFGGKTCNISAPQHHTYESLHQQMGKINKRRPLFPIPEILLTGSIGQLSSVLLQSQRMHPTKLLQSGFIFQYGNLRNALLSRDLL